MTNDKDNKEFLYSGITSPIKALSVNDSHSFPISMLRSVRSISSAIALECSRKYITRSDREKGLIFVTRIQ